MTELTLKVTDDSRSKYNLFKNNPSIFQAPNRYHEHSIIGALVGIFAYSR